MIIILMQEEIFTIIATVCAVIFGSTQSILVPILIANIVYTDGTPYYILLVSAFFFMIIFLLIYIPIKKLDKTSLIRYDKNSWIIFVLTGCFDAFTGIFIIYASDARRTPIVLQTILAGTTIVFTMVVSKKLITAKKNVDMFNRYVGISLSLLLLSIIISSIPEYSDSQWTPWDSFWIIVYLLGMACRGTYNTLQEKFIELKGNTFNNKITVLFWTCFFQFWVMGLFIWLDIIPGFGYSTVDVFFEQSRNFFECYFSMGCRSTLGIGLGFVCAYVGSYFAAVYLNAKSANYSMLANTLIAPTVILFFTIFPHLNTGLKYPIYITIPAIVLNIASVVVWRIWEIKVVDNMSKYQLIPS